MSYENDTENTSKNGGGSISATPSIALLNRKLGISPTPRMLTKSEIELLKQSELEVAQVTREVLANRNVTSHI